MQYHLVNAGCGCRIPSSHIENMGPTNSAPIQRLIKELKKTDMVQDYSGGNRTRSVVYLKSGRVVLSSVSIETLESRYEAGDKNSKAYLTTEV